MFIDMGEHLINTDNVSMIEMDKGNLVIYLSGGEVISYTIGKEDMRPDIYIKIVGAISRGDRYLHLGVDKIENF